uniref:NIN-like protein n=1 Tax=Syphacia muris TaxID=451379 RepID=A0A0N5AFR6_9BILA
MFKRTFEVLQRFHFVFFYFVLLVDLCFSYRLHRQKKNLTQQLQLPITLSKAFSLEVVHWIIRQSTSAVTTSCDSAIDSWEELDHDDSKLDEVNTHPLFYDQFHFVSYLTLVLQIQSALGRVKIRKPKVDFFASTETFSAAWDEKDLPNVLEAYDLPPRKTYDDIKYELAKLDCADVTFQKVDESHCLISFSSANRGACPWLRLRSICDASAAGKEKARLRSSCLKPYKPRPQTTMVVARRLVENALGKRSNVSAEQRKAERKRLNDAKAKKSTTANY